jgi:hypothetical protein
MRIVVMILWSGLAWAQVASSMSAVEPVTSEPAKQAKPISPDNPVDPNSLIPNSPAPKGKATLVGGTITRLDRVQDQLVIRPFGGGETKVLFDGRTQVFSDGNKASPRDLQPGQKAYVDIVPDKSEIFAKAIRVVSQGNGGESRGQIVSFDRDRSEIMLNDGLSPETFRVQIAPGTKIVRGDKETSTNSLLPGTLVALKFNPAHNGVIAAREISILAEPGTSFTFQGKVSFLDLHRGLVVVVDPRDKKSYEIHFNPVTVRIAGDLQLDSNVTVNAAFNGQNYATSAIMVNATAD